MNKVCWFNGITSVVWVRAVKLEKKRWLDEHGQLSCEVKWITWVESILKRLKPIIRAMVLGEKRRSYLDITNYVKVMSGSNGTSCVMWVDWNDGVVFEK